MQVKPYADMAVTLRYYALSVGLLNSRGLIQNYHIMVLIESNTNKNWALVKEN